MLAVKMLVANKLIAKMLTVKIPTAVKFISVELEKKRRTNWLQGNFAVKDKITIKEGH